MYDVALFTRKIICLTCFTLPVFEVYGMFVFSEMEQSQEII